MSATANLILIGPMGAGKTTHGKWLARQLGRRFIDLDAHIEHHTGTSISHIFDLEGEAGFRRRESEALAEVVREQGIVLATGGGTVLSEANRALMKANGLVIHLHLPPEQQLQRLSGDRKRPLLQCADRAGRLQQLSDIRTPLYRSCADIHIDLSRMPVSKVRQKILHTLDERARDGADMPNA